MTDQCGTRLSLRASSILDQQVPAGVDKGSRIEHRDR